MPEKIIAVEEEVEVEEDSENENYHFPNNLLSQSLEISSDSKFSGLRTYSHPQNSDKITNNALNGGNATPDPRPGLFFV